MEPVLLKHHGVKGMKWGVRKSGKTSGVGAKIESVKRERSWKKVLKDMDSKSADELNTITRRIQMENEMKRLSKNSDTSTKKDKEDYLNRSKLSDKELFEKVNKLRAKDNLSRNVKEATRSQSELGRNAVRLASVLGMSYLTSGVLSTKDIGMAAINPTAAYNNMRDKRTRDLFEETNVDLFKKAK